MVRNDASQPISSEQANVEAFIGRWSGRQGGAERANYALFLVELCDALNLPRPEPASAHRAHNDYVFERVLDRRGRDGSVSHPRIDLYKRGCFILEAKQSLLKGARKALVGQVEPLLGSDSQMPRGRRGAERAWDVLMFHARRQAEDYVPSLPSDHGQPPFLIVCDVGHCLEFFANFRRAGADYEQFPDRQGFRVYLEDLRDTTVRERLRLIWTDPAALDPALHASRVTRAIAAQLAQVSKALEARGHAPERVATFLMRCIFTMFAADVGLLPQACFKDLLARCEADPTLFVPFVGQLWEAMDEGTFAFGIGAFVKRFNGRFFKERDVLPLGQQEIAKLREAAEHVWRDVDPSIFGTLLEQALDPQERRRLGAHYTPRAFVERMVVATVIEPLRADWLAALTTAELRKSDGRLADAQATIKGFHARLCATRVLDPACGTANFLYVAMELMKRLEGEILEAFASFGGQESLTNLEGQGVEPRQFFGLEINRRAAAIAELVLWIGHLQGQLRSRMAEWSPPILKDHRNIHASDALVLSNDDQRRPDWPEAEFIVGNPPFLGGKDVRARLGSPYAQALRHAQPAVNESADLVMSWWDHAADLLVRPGTVLRRFGFVTTNSIAQVFQRRVVQRHLSAPTPISILMAVPDHPWTQAAPDCAAVRIAMTVCEAGSKPGILREVVREAGLDSDSPEVELGERLGTINADLTVGVDVTAARALFSNAGLCSPGVKLHGAGFIVDAPLAARLGLGRREGLEHHVRPYRNGRDLTSRSRDVLVIDLFGLSADEVLRRFPEVYQHLLITVKPERDANRRESYRASWWVFGEPRRELRPALTSLRRHIATVETAKHRVFQFLDAAILPDNMLVNVASADAFDLGVLSSRHHIVWALRTGGWMGIGNDHRYSKSRCFDPYPFPAADDLRRQRVRAIAEDLDAHRKRVLAEHAHVTLTGLYNVLDALKRGIRLGELAAVDRRTFDDGLVLILGELHERLDRAVAESYGWPPDLADDAILERLMALNRQRMAEEAVGLVRWLRPDYQVPRFGSLKDRAELALVGGGGERALSTPPVGPKATYPADDAAQTAVVMAALAKASGPLDAEGIAVGFRRGHRVVPRISAVLFTLYRLGIVGTLDGGLSFALQRAA